MNINPNQSLSDFISLTLPKSGEETGFNEKVSEPKDVSRPQGCSRTEIPPGTEVISFEDLAFEAEVKPGIDNKTLEEKLQGAVKERHTIGNKVKNFFKMCGRGIMNAFSAIRGARSFYHAKSVAHFNTELNVIGRGASVERSAWKTNLDPSKVVGNSDKEIAAAFGLRGNVEVKKFSAEQIRSIKDGNFSLADIKQDPGLQDCWFLSSLGAFLAKGGSGSLSDLIHIPAGENNQPPEHAYVKLGTDVYKVPLGIVTGGGEKNISDSAPWVNLLETAMQMHLIKNTDPNEPSTNGPRMAERNVQDAFAALQGVKHEGFRSASVNVKATLSKVHAFFETGCPVVLGSPKDAPFFALSTGISPGHAVTVVGVETGDRLGNGRVTVLDPYGHTTVINEQDLQQFDMFAATPERGEKFMRSEQLYDRAKEVKNTNKTQYNELMAQRRAVESTIGTDEAEVAAAQDKLIEKLKEKEDRDEMNHLAEEFSVSGRDCVSNYSPKDFRSVSLLLRTMNSADLPYYGFSANIKEGLLDMMPAALSRIRSGGNSGEVTLQDWWKALGLKGVAPDSGVSAEDAGNSFLKALADKVVDDFISSQQKEIDEAGFDVDTVRKYLNPKDEDEFDGAYARLDQLNRAKRESINQKFSALTHPVGLNYDKKFQCLSEPGKGITKDDFYCRLSPQKSDFKHVSFEYDTMITEIQSKGRATGTKFFLKAKDQNEYEEVYTCGVVSSERNVAEITALNKFKVAGFTAEQVVLLALAQNNTEMMIESSVGAAPSQYNWRYEVSRDNNTGDMQVKVMLPLCETVNNLETGAEEYKPIGRNMIHEFVIHPDGTSDCTGLEFVDDPKPEVA